MRHYTITQWLDYERGAVSPERRAAMDGHLETGCGACLERRRLMVDLRAALLPVEETPPSEVVGSVRSLFTLRRPGGHRELPRIGWRLLFDSRSSPLPAGARSLGAEGWQALYQSDDHALDLKLDLDRRGEQVCLVGQVMRRQEGEAGRGLPVTLTAGEDEELVACTWTDRLGEFEMDYRADLQPTLRLAVGKRGVLQVELDRMSHGESDLTGPDARRRAGSRGEDSKESSHEG